MIGNSHIPQKKTEPHLGHPSDNVRIATDVYGVQYILIQTERSRPADNRKQQRHRAAAGRRGMRVQPTMVGDVVPAGQISQKNKYSV